VLVFAARFRTNAGIPIAEIARGTVLILFARTSHALARFADGVLLAVEVGLTGAGVSVAFALWGQLGTSEPHGQQSPRPTGTSS
jgi:hypothetical protein